MQFTAHGVRKRELRGLLTRVSIPSCPILLKRLLSRLVKSQESRENELKFGGMGRSKVGTV